MADIYIERTYPSSKKYKFFAIKNMAWGKSTGLMDMSLPGDDDPLIMDIEGQKRTLKFNFEVVLQTDDMSMGTEAGTIKTIKEQEQYIMDIIQLKDTGTKWTMVWDDRLDTGGEKVTIRSINFYPQGAGQLDIGEIDMIFGEVVT